MSKKDSDEVKKFIENVEKKLDELEDEYDDKGNKTIAEELDDEDEEESEEVEEEKSKKSSSVKGIIFYVCLLVVMVAGVVVGVMSHVKTAESKEQQSLLARANKEKIESKIDESRAIKDLKEQKANNFDKTKESIKEDAKEPEVSRLYKEYENLSDKEKEKLEVIPRKEEIPIEELDVIKDKIEDVVIDDPNVDPNAIPARFNLKDVIPIKVENQGQYGLCWAFASQNTLETHLALKTGIDYDFSEMYLNYMESEKLGKYRQVDTGGSFWNFENLMRHYGVADEATYPYRDYSQSEYIKFPDNYKQDVYVTEFINYPGLYKWDENITEDQIQEFRNTVKKHIMTCGGLYTSVVGPTPTGAYMYTDHEDNDVFSNHAMTIIGWDDNCPKENFKSSTGKTPTKDGAYIILNSWGEGYGEQGIYYYSYEDKYVETQLSGVISCDLADAYKLSDIKSDKIRNFILERFGDELLYINNEQYLKKSSLNNLYHLDLSGRDLTDKDLADLKMFKNVSSLDLSSNQITKLDFLDDFSHIYDLDLRNNKIKNIEPIIKHTEINTLDLSQNSGIQNLKSLSKLENMYMLSIADANITSIDWLKDINANMVDLSGNFQLKLSKVENEKITDLNLSGCNLIEIKNIGGFKNLNTLDISVNNITKLTGLEELEYLHHLNISDNQNIIDFSSIQKLPVKDRTEYPEEEYYGEDDYEEGYYYEGDYYVSGLTIIASSCNLVDINSIYNEKLEYLDLSYNIIRDVSQNFQKVRAIVLDGNYGVKGLLYLNNVESLSVANCGIKNLKELGKLTNLQYLDISQNDFRNLEPLNEMTKLNHLTINNNNQDITGKLKLENLYGMDIKGTIIDEGGFDLSGLPNLYSIFISDLDKNLIKEIIKGKNEVQIVVDLEDTEALSEETLKSILSLDMKKSYMTIENFELNKNVNRIDGIISTEDAFNGITFVNKQDISSIENGYFDRGRKNIHILGYKEDLSIEEPEEEEVENKVNNTVVENTTNTTSNEVKNEVTNEVTNETSNEVTNEATNEVTNEVANTTLNTVNETTKNTVKKETKKVETTKNGTKKEATKEAVNESIILNCSYSYKNGIYLNNFKIVLNYK